jgi:hypothetical protein
MGVLQFRETSFPIWEMKFSYGPDPSAVVEKFPFISDRLIETRAGHVFCIEISTAELAVGGAFAKCD